MNEYFSHDYNARNDLNIKKLLMGEGLTGLGIYWCLIEMLYENNGYIDLDAIPTIAYDLRTNEAKINNVINKYNLFCKTDSQFFSNGILKRLNTRNEKSEKARKSVEARWGKEREKTDSNAIENQSQYDNDTSVLRANYDCNTIKENKIKEDKNILKDSKNILSKQASNLKKEETNSACACEGKFQKEDYDDLLDGFGVFGEYRNAVFRFIGHLKVNFNLVMLNDRLENLIVRLDLRYFDVADKIRAIDDAIAKGYKRLECE